jgi:homoserine kinase
VVEVVWDETARREDVIVAEPGHSELPADPTQHTAAIAAAAVLRAAAVQTPGGIVLRVTKGLPLAGGQGGSAASAVAGAVAVNALLGSPLHTSALLSCALEAEEHVAGRHADNVAPALLGGVVLVRSMDPLDAIRISYPPTLRVVLVLPNQQLRTATARDVLPTHVTRELALQQAANIAAIVAALASGDLDLLRRALHDGIAEPARGPLLPGFAEAKRAALTAGALGCSISGAGPTSFAFAADDGAAAVIAAAMREAYATKGVSATSRVARVDDGGAHVELLSEDDVPRMPC